ncbi:MAG: hypothetical protein EHV01_005740 [Spiroplasma sp. hy2]|uniref:hypothetical protein n=1 Tax=Spiroplasma sp. hy2 TaxID=2490850 RepID=UPI003B4EAB03
MKLQFAFFEIWDCWVDKKKVRIQFSTNKEATESYFANWINQKKDNLYQSIKKIKSYDADFNFIIPNFEIPTTIIAKNSLNTEIEQLEKQLNEIAKEKYKLLLQTIDNTVFRFKETSINNNLTIKEIIINDEKITLELIRNKLNKFLQEYENSLLIFINSTLKYGFISFTKKHQSKINLNNFLQTNKNAFAISGGGTALFISFTFQNDIKPFLDLLIARVKQTEMD